jgi:hypothetical protein
MTALAWVLGGFLALSAAFFLGCRFGRTGALIRSMVIHRQAVSDVIDALGATQTHGGDCDRAFRQLAAIIIDQQVELLAYRGYVAEIEGAENLGDEAAEFLRERGGS